MPVVLATKLKNLFMKSDFFKKMHDSDFFYLFICYSQRTTVYSSVIHLGHG